MPPMTQPTDRPSSAGLLPAAELAWPECLRIRSIGGLSARGGAADGESAVSLVRRRFPKETGYITAQMSRRRRNDCGAGGGKHVVRLMGIGEGSSEYGGCTTRV